LSTPDIAAAMNAAMDGENRRRQLASGTPGLGAVLRLPQSPAAAAVGKSSLDMPAIGEGYAQGAPDAPQRKSYGPDLPVYADDLVGGYGFQGGRSEPAVRHVTDLGADGLFIEGRSAPAASPWTLISPPAGRQSLFRRWFRRR
jgi:hypothetical protein